MSQLSTMISMEYRMDIKTKSFWISTFLFPLLMVAFGVFVGYMTSESDAMKSVGETTGPGDDMTGMQVMGMLAGIFLTMFVIMYGSQIFNKVKTEKCNRIVEVLISCQSGRSVMLAKVISVALVGITQMLVWLVLIAGIVVGILFFVPVEIPWSELFTHPVGIGIIEAILYFVGGFVFYGALFSAAGALMDRNNENQGYLSLLMMLLMVSFYIGIFATDSQGSPLAVVCFYLPFTSSTVGAVLSVGQSVAWWQTVLSIAILYGSAYFALVLAGKIYTSAVLLKGKKFSPRDILTFIKSK
ncbi:MAG: ABC transporter permease [Prevotella sp.]|nr:ABC transporter permease [Prevotella sp.]MCM1074292.1 ABC transporter permease [Ruminococcus sp.]